MISIEDQLRSIPHILDTLESKITKLELAKPEVTKFQTRLDDLDERITLRKYPITTTQISNMLELQALLNYASGDLKGAQSNIKEAVVTAGKPELVTKLAKDISANLGKVEATDKKQLKKDIPEYFTVSALRLTLLSFLTFGLYSRYWAYKNWKAVEEISVLNKKGKVVKVHPILSAIFFPLISYELFVRVRNSMGVIDKDKKVRAGLSAWFVFFLSYAGLTFIPLLATQRQMNYIKEKAHGNKNVHSGTSVGEVIFVLLGLAYTALVIVSLVNSSGSGLSSDQSAKKSTMDSLTAQYTLCSEALATRRPSVDTTSNVAIDSYNADLAKCEEVRLKQNAAVDEYNHSIGM